MSNNASWSLREEASFLNFLIDHRAEAGDGCNFKKATMQQAAQHIQPLHVRGGAKTQQTCKNKFTAFRKLFRIVRAVQAISGWSWDDNTGASIDVHTASSWDDYARRHPDARPFRNKGWVHFRKMEMLMPATVAGANVYHASSAASEPVDNDPGSPSSSNEDAEPNLSQPVGTPRNDSPEPEDAVMPSSSQPVSAKRQRAPATPTRADVKRVRATGSAALMSIADSLTAFNTTLATSLALPAAGTTVAPSPIRRREAITTALTLEKNWLTPTERATFVDFLKSDLCAADVYMAIEEVDVRQEWVRMQLERLGIFVTV
ncbi:hypothetical protein D9619_003790 [Psilocybe cf. subviscida]|uniref:Myb/SANT-like domain-containing protein n=1 Tax=Psilocybe cf. subviscida TaxID=2480587 RepID=A0A8H5AW91_9AGAR|nr:hypothetical protein D9619_003790 [Psilocybe cf. subviscida]